MFTGIVQAIGEILDFNGESLVISFPNRFKLDIGDSLAVNGVCLTAREIKKNAVTCDCVPETLRVTTLGKLKKGDPVNLELPLTLESRLGGHIVQGHVDGIGSILSANRQGNSLLLRVRTSAALSRYFIPKGSVALDGVSLTIVKTFPGGFTVALVPVTQTATTLGRKKKGDRVNIEVDFIAKQIEKLLAPYQQRRKV